MAFVPLRILSKLATETGLKRALKDLWWNYQGRSIGNPPLPQAPRSILFICLGNICRSPFASAIAARHARDRAISLRCESAGLRTRQAAEPPSDARQAAKAFGVSLDNHRPLSATPDLLLEFDLIVVMEYTQMQFLRTSYPELASRICLLPLLDETTTGLERYNIIDPFSSSRAVFESCYRRIDRLVIALFAAVGYGSIGTSAEGTR